MNFASALEHRDAVLFQQSFAHLGELRPLWTLRHRLIALALTACVRTGLVVGRAASFASVGSAGGEVSPTVPLIGFPTASDMRFAESWHF
jgi:hypothetical protein